MCSTVRAGGRRLDVAPRTTHSSTEAKHYLLKMAFLTCVAPAPSLRRRLRLIR